MDLTPQGSYSLKQVFGFTCKVWFKGALLQVLLITIYMSFTEDWGGDIILIPFLGSIIGLAVTIPAAIIFWVLSFLLLNNINLQNPKAILCMLLSLILLTQLFLFSGEIRLYNDAVLFIMGLIFSSALAIGTTKLEKDFVTQQ